MLDHDSNSFGDTDAFKLDDLDGQEYILGSGTATIPEILSEFEKGERAASFT